MQREFARLYVLNGGIGRHAAIDAGYSPHTADRAAQKCLTSRLVNAEIQRRSISNLSAKLPMLIGYLLDMAADQKTDARARVQAITALMDRAGATRQTGQAMVAVQVNVGNGTAAQELIAEIWNDKKARERALVGGELSIEGKLVPIGGPVRTVEKEDAPRCARLVEGRL